MDNLLLMPCWYFYIGLIWSTFQGTRGVIEHNRNYKDKNLKWYSWEKWVILFVHDFAFRFICAFTGFASLFLSYTLFSEGGQLLTLNPASSALLIFLLLIGVIGIGGQLHYIILLGKVPR